MNIAIAGAGLLGRLLAFELLQQDPDIRITLYDRDRVDGVGSCAMSAAGMISPYLELEKSNDTLCRAGKDSLSLWPAILQKLEGAVYFQHQGSLVMAHRDDEANLQHYLRKITRQCEMPPYRMVLAAEIEPEIGTSGNGYYFSEEGQLDSQQLMKQLALALVSRVNWLPQQEVMAVKPHEIHLRDTIDTYDWVFDCRGMGAVSNFPELRALRGELIWLDAPAVTLTRPIRWVHPRYTIYIVPRPHHRYIVGATEVEAEDYSPISVRAMLELLSAVYSVHKGFIDARIVHTTTQCRPTLPEHFPVIKYRDGFTAINGLYRHGIMLAPSIVADVIGYLQDGFKKVRYSTWWENVCDSHSIQ